MHEGYRWALQAQDGLWLWKVILRDSDTVLAEGAAATRAEGAACLVRTLSLAALAADAPAAA